MHQPTQNRFLDRVNLLRSLGCRLLYEDTVQKLIRDGIAPAYEEAGSGLPPMLST
jgi:hypothetical protein